VRQFIKSNLFYYSILLFAFVTPLSQYAGVRLLVILTFFSFFHNHAYRLQRFFKNAWDILLFLTVLAVGLFYSDDKGTGWKVLETSFSLLALSIVFSAISISRKQVSTILLFFVSGLLLASLICLVTATVSFYESHHIESFFFYQLTEVINLQPTYLAYYLCFAISYLLYELYNQELNMNRLAVTGIIVLFFVVLMLTAGRTAYISMLFSFSFFILKFISDDEVNAGKKRTAFMSAFLLLAMLAINYFDFNIISSGMASNNDYWERITLWKSAIEANPDFILGVGTGDYKNVLNQYYSTHNLADYAHESLNSHNQFIHSFFANGLLGLISLLMVLGRPLYVSVRQQNVLGILVFFSFLIYGVTEVFFGRYQGVVFFALLHQLFISHYDSVKLSNALKAS